MVMINDLFRLKNLFYERKYKKTDMSDMNTCVTTKLPFWSNNMTKYFFLRILKF